MRFDMLAFSCEMHDVASFFFSGLGWLCMFAWVGESSQLDTKCCFIQKLPLPSIAFFGNQFDAFSERCCSGVSCEVFPEAKLKLFWNLSGGCDVPLRHSRKTLQDKIL
eukprot:4029320-Amphidinium_carterae.1